MILKPINKGAGDVLLPYLGMYVTWSLWQLFVQPQIRGAGWIPVLITVGVKALIWLTPILFYRKPDRWHIPIKEMFTSSFPWHSCLAMACGTLVFLHTVRIITGRQNTTLVWDPIVLLFSASAGIIEEISFRGFIFNRQAASLRTLPAALINGVLFAIFHYPALIIGQSWAQLCSWRFVMLLMVGILFSMAFARWKNIWLTIIVHTFWNILSYLWALI